MDYSGFTRKELAEILALIQACIACESRVDVVKVIKSLKKLLADHCTCALGHRCHAIRKSPGLDDPAGWVSYAAGEFYRQGQPVNQDHAFLKTCLATGSAITREKFKKDFVNNMDEFDCGLKLCFNGSNYANGGVFPLSGEADRFTDQHKNMLDILTPHLQQALLRVSGCPSARECLNALSEREREVLAWMKQGKTNWEISVILDISERTVKFHVQNIERKLNAVNKAHAIAIAMNASLMA